MPSAFSLDYQPPTTLLHQRIILVTGASDGIGREAALSYARLGARLILLGRNTSKLHSVATQITAAGGLPAETFTLDLDGATPEQCQQLADNIARQVPHLDGVLHNAGLLGEVAPMTEQTPAIWQQVMRVNIDSTFFLTQALLPLLLKSPAASLIFTTSSVGRQARAQWGAYSVSKFATEGMMQVLADEYQHTHLRVNCINPGGTRTKMRASAFPDENADKLKTPAEIMPLYQWLMGDDSRGINGQSLDAQPGRKAGPAE
ncbi:YciK family oxidoreductase [Enterobacterales bacterium CwR94]|nr:YciK family oxidoreductase [Enterobacterales bacterium CwR94]